MSAHPPYPDRGRGLPLDVATITVDPAYVEAAARRAMSGAPDRRRPGVAFVAVLAAVGLLAGVAAAQTRQRAPATARLRQQLAREVRERTAMTDRLRGRIADLREETAAARRRLAQRTLAGRQLADRLDRLDLATASIAVRGPGIEVRLADAPPGPDGVTEDDGQIRDVDLQQVVNSLWAAGAEAVAINGQRLSTLTAIREAGQAIQVDYRPLSPPYVVSAIGDPDVIEPAFGDSATARRFHTWEDVFGLSFHVRRRDRITLPAAETTRLRYAEAGSSGKVPS